jgi:hypothetical protein
VTNFDKVNVVGFRDPSVESFSYDWRRVWDEVEVPHYEGGSRVVGKSFFASFSAPEKVRERLCFSQERKRNLSKSFDDSNKNRIFAPNYYK